MTLFFFYGFFRFSEKKSCFSFVESDFLFEITIDQKLHFFFVICEFWTSNGSYASAEWSKVNSGGIFHFLQILSNFLKRFFFLWIVFFFFGIGYVQWTNRVARWVPNNKENRKKTGKKRFFYFFLLFDDEITISDFCYFLIPFLYFLLKKIKTKSRHRQSLSYNQKLKKSKIVFPCCL